MNALALSVICLTVLPIIIGLLLGLLRGSRRSILALCLVIVCIIVAFAFRGLVSDKVMNMQVTVDGQQGTVAELIVNMLPEQFRNLGDVVVPLVQCIVQVLVFFALFLSSLLLTWIIVYPICSIFVKPKKIKQDDGKVKYKKHRLIGCAIGLVSGVLIGVCFALPMSGLVANVGTIAVQAIEMQDATTPNAQASEPQGSGAAVDGLDQELIDMLTSYRDSGVCRMYSTKPAEKLFGLISRVKAEDGGKVTLPEQIKAFERLLKMAQSLSKFDQLDSISDALSGNLTPENLQQSKDQIRDLFSELGSLTGDDLSEEAKKTIDKTLDALGDSLSEQFDVDIDLSGVDFSSVDFEKEGEIFSDLLDYGVNSDTIDEETAKDIVKRAAESDLVIPMLQSTNVGESIPDDMRDQIGDILDDLQGDGSVDESVLDTLRDIFGINP